MSRLYSLMLNNIKYMIEIHGFTYIIALSLYFIVTITFACVLLFAIIDSPLLLFMILLFIFSSHATVLTWLYRQTEITYNYIETVLAYGISRAIYLLAHKLSLIIQCLPFSLACILLMCSVEPKYFLQSIMLVLSTLLFYSTSYILHGMSFTCIRVKLWRAIITLWSAIILASPFFILFSLPVKLEISYLGTSIIDCTTPIIFTFLVTISLLNFLLSYVIFNREALVLYSVRLRRR